jgi:hypothetical protein
MYFTRSSENSTASYQYKRSFQAVFLVAGTELAIVLYRAASTETVAAVNFGRRRHRVLDVQ